MMIGTGLGCLALTKGMDCAPVRLNGNECMCSSKGVFRAGHLSENHISRTSPSGAVAGLCKQPGFHMRLNC